MAVEIKVFEVGESDILFFEEILSDNEFKKFFVISPSFKNDARLFLQYLINQNKQDVGLAYTVKCDINGDWETAGFIECSFENGMDKAIVNYAMLQEYRGYNIITTALEMVLASLQEWGVHEAECRIYQGNNASEAVVRKLLFDKQPILLFDNATGIQQSLWSKWLQSIPSEALESLKCRIDADEHTLNKMFKLSVSYCQTYGLQPVLHARCLFLKARCFFSMGNYENCEEHLRQSNLVSHKAGLGWDYENYFWLGQIEEKIGVLDGAKYYYNCAIENFRPGLSMLTYDELTSNLERVSQQ